MSADVLPEPLVMGGGIGGRSAALRLARRGGTVTVIERSKSFAELSRAHRQRRIPGPAAMAIGTGAASPR